jgi:hypothetical protein
MRRQPQGMRRRISATCSAYLKRYQGCFAKVKLEILESSVRRPDRFLDIGVGMSG